MAEELSPLVSQEEIAAVVHRIAAELDRDYAGRSPLLVGILNGAFVFLADLMRQMDTPIRGIAFIRVSSYGSGTTSSGKAEITLGLPQAVVKEQDVILVEDIVDTGISAVAALRYLRRHGPASLKLCSLMDKPSRREVPVTIDYLGLTVPNTFLVGHDLDKDQRYRQLPDLNTVSE